MADDQLVNWHDLIRAALRLFRLWTTSPPPHDRHPSTEKGSLLPGGGWLHLRPRHCHLPLERLLGLRHVLLDRPQGPPPAFIRTDENPPRPYPLCRRRRHHGPRLPTCLWGTCRRHLLSQRPNRDQHPRLIKQSHHPPPLLDLRRLCLHPHPRTHLAATPLALPHHSRHQILPAPPQPSLTLCPHFFLCLGAELYLVFLLSCQSCACVVGVGGEIVLWCGVDGCACVWVWFK